ncbi:histone-lysine N-methyltransferase SETMAR [Trichonephila clavipes]|nr:histone-lysine N-methyltransferase SETMAR [Trichonephila clavipes]
MGPNEIAVVPDFHKRILFSDEAHFWLNGYVNKQNCRIWSEANPQVYVETPLPPEKLTVWCALWAGGIIGPYFFKNDEGHNVTVNGDRYRAMITNFFIPELNNHDVQELWFQQDGATCHAARATIDLLKDTFGDRLISRFGPVNWPPRSCDLTPLDYFLWGYVKSLVSMRISHKRLTIWKTTFALLPIYGHKYGFVSIPKEFKRPTNEAPESISGCSVGLDRYVKINVDLRSSRATRGILATDHVILNHGQVTWTTPELAPPLLTTTPHQREDVSPLDRFNVHCCPTRRVFSGTGLKLVTRPATIQYLDLSATAASGRRVAS